MKRNKLFTLLFFLLPALLLSSCLKDQEDYFDESASARLSNYKDNARRTLMNAPYGWLFELNKSSASADEYGGYAFTCKFDSLTVDVRSELDTTKVVTSYYKITAETAATLVFDTYNELIHNFAEGTASLYHGYGGDVNYVIDSVSTDLVKVHGARSLQTYYLRRLDRPAKQYLQDQAAFVKRYNDESFTKMSGEINGVAVNGEVNGGSLSAEMTVGDNAETAYFAFTSQGIRFTSPLQVGDATISELVYNFDSRAYTGTDSKGAQFSLKAAYPEWVQLYNAWAGEWTIGYQGDDGNLATIDVILTPTADRSAYIMHGLAAAFDVTLKYIKSANAVEINTQYVGEPLPNGNLVRLTMWDCSGGYVGTSSGYGLRTKWNEANKRYEWVDNGAWARGAEGIMLREYTTGETRVGNLSSAYPDYLVNGSYRMAYISTFTKKN